MKTINLKKNKKKIALMTCIIAVIMIIMPAYVVGEPVIPKIGLDIGPAENTKDAAASIQLLVLITILSLAPSILIMMTSFTRIVIVLSFLRNALGTQQMPPNQVLVGLALFLTFFVMNPVISDINQNAFQPFIRGEITQQDALDRSSDRIKKFMVNQIMNHKREKDLALFISLSGTKAPSNPEDLSKLPLTIVVPAFMISELTIAFKIGFLIFIPFLIIDMVVSSTLMSMGMMMLPPVMISLPFKILLFIMVDGWNLVAQSIVKSFS